jgi:hypothetical protein
MIEIPPIPETPIPESNAMPDFNNLTRERAIEIFVNQVILSNNIERMKNKFTSSMNHIEIAILESVLIQVRSIAKFLHDRYNITREEYIQYIEKIKGENPIQTEEVDYGKDKNDNGNVQGYA